MKGKMLRSKSVNTVESNKDKAHSLDMEIVESNVELNDSDVVQPDYDEFFKGYKARGMAKGMLGLWEDAARDLHIASKFDFDGEATVMLKKVICISLQ